MYLELKKAREYLEGHLRSVLRLAKKKGIQLRMVARGAHKQSVMITISNAGPMYEKTEVELFLFAKKDNHFVVFSRQVDFEQDLDYAELVQQVEMKLESCPVVLPPEDEDAYEFSSIDTEQIDEKLLVMDIEELISFFRSRFIIDAPKKLIYDADISRGFLFQAYLEEGRALAFAGHSFFTLSSHMRTKLSHIRHECCGKSLRDLRLWPIRRQLEPFWRAKAREVQEENLPKRIIFGAQALKAFAEACLSAMKEKNDQLWNWLEPLNKDDIDMSVGICGLMEGKSSLILNQLSPFFRRWKHPVGKLVEPLSDLLSGRSQEYDEYIYIHDVKVLIKDSRIVVLTSGSNLHISKKENPIFINQMMELMIHGESLRKAKSSQSMSFLRYKDLWHYVWIPEYVVHEDVDLQMRLIPY